MRRKRRHCQRDKVWGEEISGGASNMEMKIKVKGQREGSKKKKKFRGRLKNLVAQRNR